MEVNLDDEMPSTGKYVVLQSWWSSAIDISGDTGVHRCACALIIQSHLAISESRGCGIRTL